MIVASSAWGGLGWLWLPICLVMMIGCMMMMSGMMRHGDRGWRGWYYGQRTDGKGQTQPPQSAEEILASRLARGEINIDEYNRLLSAIEEHRTIRSGA